MSLFKCKHCEKEFENKRKLAGHSTWCESNPNKQKNLEILKESREKVNLRNSLNEEIIATCKWCNKEFILTRSKLNNHVRWCADNPNLSSYKEMLGVSRAKNLANPESLERMKASLQEAHKRGDYREANFRARGRPGHKHTQEQKENLSKKRKDWLSKNPDKHPWKLNTKFISLPCENLKKLLRNSGILFEEEFTPLTERHFSLDIAFPEKKIGIEVNGEQHYNRDGSLKKYYQERHDLIESKGWKLFELHYAECYNDSIIDKIKSLL